jgi:hypothetical protein
LIHNLFEVCTVCTLVQASVPTIINICIDRIRLMLNFDGLDRFWGEQEYYSDCSD